MEFRTADVYSNLDQTTPVIIRGTEKEREEKQNKRKEKTS
jgi:hypothetical protein